MQCVKSKKRLHPTSAALERGGDEVAQDGGRRFGVLPLKTLSPQLDIKEDSIETVMSYLEVKRCCDDSTVQGHGHWNIQGWHWLSLIAC
jgi:hypothetical protein